MHLKTPNFLKNRKLWLATLLIFAASFLAAPNVLAISAGDWAGEVVGGIIYVFIWALGLVLILVMKGLILIASYQNFISSGAVQEGWTVVRDLSNMFFVVILLVIAFSTILHLENYSYKKWLPKLVLMAVLINFSKTICGLLIDVAQIIMLTFVNAFKDVAGGNLIEMLGIREIVTLAEGSDSVGFWQIVGAYVLGLIYMIIALVVITTMMMMLVMRLVMIWIYVVLSPLAYLLAAFPGGAQYASQWWKEFISNLVVGPVIAFFIWLSFAALQTGNYDDVGQVGTADIGSEQTAFTGTIAKVDGASTPSMGTKASTPGVLIKFVIGIGMLIGGLKVAQQIGGAAGSVAGKGMGKLAAMGAATAAFGKKWGGKTLSGDNYLARKTARLTGVDIRPFKLAQSIKAFSETSKRKDESEIVDRSRGRLEAGGAQSLLGFGAGEDYFHRHIDGFLGYKGLKRAAKETFINPGKRADLGEQIDVLEKESQLNSKKRERILEDNAPDIDQKTNQLLSSDRDYNDGRDAINKVDASILALRSKGSLSDPEKNELKKLEDKKANLEAGQRSKETVVRKGVEDDFIESNASIKEIDAKISINQASLNKLKGELFAIQKPMALQARSEYRKSVEEAKSKYKTITNADELLKALTDAEQRGDKFDQIAILEKITSDANFNEVLRSRGYSSDAVGFQKFIDNSPNVNGEQKGLSGKLFSDKQKLEVQNDISESAERVGHWDMAKMVGMNSKGELESLVKKTVDPSTGDVLYDDSDHAKASYAEIIKMDPQKIVNSLNRLAMGGEDANGVFQISTLGKMIYKNLSAGGVYSAQQGRILSNTAANLSQPHIISTLRQIDNNERELNAIIARGINKSGAPNTADNMYDTLSESGFIKPRK